MDKIKLDNMSEAEREVCIICPSHLNGICMKSIKGFSKKCPLIQNKFKLPLVQREILKYMEKKTKEEQIILKYHICNITKQRNLHGGGFLAHIETLKELDLILILKENRGVQCVFLKEKYRKKRIWNRKFPLALKLKQILELFKDKDYVHPNEIKRHGFVTAKEMEYFKIIEELGLIKEIWEGNTRFFKRIKYLGFEDKN